MRATSIPRSGLTIDRSTSMKSSATRSRPAFEKIVIGPVMVFGQTVTGGHYMDILRLSKQMAVGRGTTPSYWNIHNHFVSQSGLFGAFYRGYLPWGLLKCAEGIPVLFVQHESMHQLQTRAGWSHNSAEKASGFLGGIAQAIVVNPLQKIMVTIVAADTPMQPMETVQAVIRQHGIMSLYDGVGAMMLRRGFEWGIRFGMSSDVKHWLVQQKIVQDQSPELNSFELLGCGLVGGALSALTHPIDNIVTNCQKPMPRGVPGDLLSVVRRMHSESGFRAFTRGWGIRVVDNAYHMAWMYGIGTVVYEWMDKNLRDPDEGRYH